jgi:cell division transport system permease protein
MRQWLNQHLQAIRVVLSRMRRNSLATLMMCCVIGVTLCLPGILYVAVDNLNRLAGNIQSEPQISLFLKLDIKPEVVAALDQQLRNLPDIKSYRFVSKDTAWRQLQLNAGTAGVANNLEKNPLPDAYFVQPKAADPAAVEHLQKDLQQLSGVELAQVDANWIKRLYTLLELGKKAILVLAALLGFALLAIVGNTIRMQILTQREEIEVSKLIGATDGFIRRPFLYAGALYGMGGGLAAWLLLAGVIGAFNFSVADIADLYASSFRLDLPNFGLSMAMLASAISLGWIGSYIAVGRSLAQFDLT